MRRKLLKVAPLLLLAVLCFLCSCQGHSHVFENWETVSAPSCEENGVEQGVCECGEVTTRAVVRTGHTQSRRVTREPDCENDGAYTVECSVCGEELERGGLARLGHELVTHEAVTATCARSGNNAYQSCGRCGYSSYKEIPRIAHQPTGAADCVSAQTCKICGEVLAEALGHMAKALQGREATCKRAGLSDGSVCAVCGDVLVEQIEIPEICHIPVVDDGVAATCESEGISDSLKCAECGETLAEAVKIPLRAHSYNGSLDRECDLCGFVRAVGSDACIHREQITARKLDSTCDGYGLTQGVTCEDCGEVLVQREVIEPKEHTEKAVRGYAARCAISGLTEGIACYSCGLVIKPQEVIKAVGHTEAEDKATEAGCETSGLSAGKHCALCAEVLVKQNSILPRGHEKIAHSGKDALCAEGGWADYYTCVSCDYSTYQAIAALGHSEVSDGGRQATCIEAGLGEGRHCSRCGEVTAVQTVIAPTGHNFGKWQSISSGCTRDEVFARVCKSCFEVESDGSPHSFKTAIKAQNCEKSGEVTVFCSACGVTAAKEKLGAFGHDLVWSVTDGGHSKKCYRAGCGYKTDEGVHKSEGGASCEDKLCDDCGYLMKNGSGHKLSSSYKSDGDSHWRKCLNSGCEYREDESPHQNSSALCSDARLRCTVCQSYYYPDSDHILGEWYEAANASVRRDCTVCGYYEVKFSDG